MAISVACVKCGKSYALKDELAGKKVRCKECESVIAVPSSSDEDELFAALDMKSTDRAVDDGDDDDYEGYEDYDTALPRPTRRARPSKKKSRPRVSRRWSPEDGMPMGVTLARWAIGVMVVVNALAIVMYLVSFAKLVNSVPRGMQINWPYVIGVSLGGLVLPLSRLAIEAHVINGLGERSFRTRVTATAMAVCMTLLLVIIWQFVLPARRGPWVHPEVLKLDLLFYGHQLLCELVVIVGLNWSSSRRYLSE